MTPPPARPFCPCLSPDLNSHLSPVPRRDRPNGDLSSLHVSTAADPTQVAAAPRTSPAETQGSYTRALIETTKPGITRLVTITSIVGFGLAFLARPAGSEGLQTHTLLLNLLLSSLGTALSAGGANAINQFMERRRDAAMNRTMGRPIPTSRVTPAAALVFGTILSIFGFGVLLFGCGPAPALVALACTLSYVLLYTPLKPITPLCTYVGTIPGALPPLIGWTAAFPAEAVLDALRHPGGWALVALMIVWQLPHSFALAWMYKDDYARGRYRLLPVVDKTGALTAGTILFWSLVQIPATILPVWATPSVTSWAYGSIALLTGLFFVHMCVKLWRTRDVADAKRVFLASIAVLPLLLTAMIAEGVIRRFF